MDKSNSPYKPEDFSVMPKELRQMILEYPLGTKTFSEEEVTWLWENQKQVVIFKSQEDGYAYTEYFLRDTEYHKGQLAFKAPIKYSFTYHADGTAEYKAQGYSFLPIEWSKMKPFGFVKRLTNTLDSDTRKRVYGNHFIDGIMFNSPDPADRNRARSNIENDKGKIETVCTDLMSIHAILYRRFNVAIPENAQYLARKYTQKCLDHIVDDAKP